MGQKHSGVDIYHDFELGGIEKGAKKGAEIQKAREVEERIEIETIINKIGSIEDKAII